MDYMLHGDRTDSYLPHEPVSGRPPYESAVLGGGNGTPHENSATCTIPRRYETVDAVDLENRAAVGCEISAKENEEPFHTVVEGVSAGRKSAGENLSESTAGTAFDRGTDIETTATVTALTSPNGTVAGGTREMIAEAEEKVKECNEAFESESFKDAPRLTYKIVEQDPGRWEVEYRMKGGHQDRYGDSYYRMVEKALSLGQASLLNCLLLDNWAKAAQKKQRAYASQPNSRTRLRNCLDLAIKFNNRGLLRRLVTEGGYDINAQNGEGWTRLDYAFDNLVQSGEDGIELELLKLGAVSGTSSTGKPITYLLHHACMYKKYSLVRFLVQHRNADVLEYSQPSVPSSPTRYYVSETPLIAATAPQPGEFTKVMEDEDKCGVFKTVKFLLDHGAGKSANFQTRPTKTVLSRCPRSALHYACAWGYVKTAALLLANGASPTLITSDGMTPLQMARLHGRRFGRWTSKPYKETSELVKAHIKISSIASKNTR